MPTPFNENTNISDDNDDSIIDLSSTPAATSCSSILPFSFPLSSSQSSTSSLIHSKFQQLINEQQKYENDPGINIGHITVAYNGYVLMLSGFKGYKENSTAFYRPSEEIWIYDQIVEKWIKKICTSETGDKDDMPLERSNACATVINDHLYMFGGFSEEGNLNSLHRLNLCTLKWRRIKPANQNSLNDQNPAQNRLMEPLACDKNVCWEYDDRFYLFGGYGPVPRVWHEDYQFQFIFDTSSHWHYVRGWNNQLVCYDPELNCWQWPKHSGQIPSARAACAAAKIGHNVYLFGGRMNRERMNDMYMLNMKTMIWTQIQSNDGEHQICGRSWHTLTPISDHMLVLYGGFSHDNQPLKDCWIFDTKTFVWREIQLPFDKPRFWHSATLSTFGEILVLGGATKELISSYQRNPKYNHIFAKDMFTIKFQPKSLLRICLSTIVDNNLQLSLQLFHILPLNLLEIIFKRLLTNNHNRLYLKLYNNYQQFLKQNSEHMIDDNSNGHGDNDDDLENKL